MEILIQGIVMNIVVLVLGPLVIKNTSRLYGLIYVFFIVALTQMMLQQLFYQYSVQKSLYISCFTGFLGTFGALIFLKVKNWDKRRNSK